MLCVLADEGLRRVPLRRFAPNSGPDTGGRSVSHLPEKPTLRPRPLVLVTALRDEGFPVRQTSWPRCYCLPFQATFALRSSVWRGSALRRRRRRALRVVPHG